MIYTATTEEISLEFVRRGAIEGSSNVNLNFSQIVRPPSPYIIWNSMIGEKNKIFRTFRASVVWGVSGCRGSFYW